MSNAERSAASPELHIRWKEPEDEPSLDALYAQAFGADALAALSQRRHWQYERNPYARRCEILVALAEGRLVGQTGGLPVPLFIDGVRQQVAWGGDTVVDPRFRRRGIASRLVSAWVERCEHALFLGLGPAEAQRQLLLGLGSRSMGSVDGYLWRGEAANERGPAGITVTPLGTEDRRIDALWARVGSCYRALVRRDRAWLEWRYARWPLPRYALFGAVQEDGLLGYSVLRVRDASRYGRLTLLVDWLAHPEDRATQAALLCHAKAWGRALGAEDVFTFSCEQRLSEQLTAAGFQRQPESSAELVVGGPGLAAVTLPGLSEWHVSLGDSDKDRVP